MRIGTFTRLFKKISNAATAHTGFSRIVAKHHHQFGVFDV
jgi:hypothetical protein